MAYEPFDRTLPDPSDSLFEVPEDIRKNCSALFDAAVSSAYPGVDMLVFGDPFMPDQILYAGTNKWIRLTIAWNTDNNPREILYELSETSSSGPWDEIGTKRITYDSSGFVDRYDWI